MWIFTKHGFYSAVAGLTKKGKVDPKVIVVRARVRKHLEDLLAAYPESFKDVEITSSDDTDYRHRIVMPAGKWTLVVACLAAEIDYPNFKGECGHGSYHTALNRVWGVMLGLQTEEERTGEDRKKPKGTGGHRPISDKPWFDEEKF